MDNVFELYLSFLHFVNLISPWFMSFLKSPFTQLLLYFMIPIKHAWTLQWHYDLGQGL